MATWQLGGLASMAPQNTNAPGADVPQPMQYQQQPNVGLMALQGLRGVAEINQQAEAAKQLKDYQKQLGDKVSKNDRAGVQQLMAQYPQFMADSQKQMGFIDAEQNRQTADAAMNLRLASQTGDPMVMQKAIMQANPVLQRFGLPAEEVYQSWQNDPQGFNRTTDLIHLHADPNSYFAVQDKITGRRLEGERNQLTARGQDITARGQDIAASTARRGQDMSYQSAMTGHNLASQRLALDQQEFGLKVQQAQEKAQQLIDGAPKLSVNMEKGIEAAVNNATASTNSADSMVALAQQFRQEKPTTGLFGNANNMFSKLTGSETALRDLRIRQSAIINSQVLKYLPPGPATDRDVNLAREGAPSTWDDPNIVADWLDANARLERRNAQFNEFKSEWMSANGNPGQSRNGGQILGLDIQKGESLGSAVKRYMAQNPIEQQAAAPNTQQGQLAQPQVQQPNYNSLWGG